MAQHLTASLEDYLEVIAGLIVRNGHAHTKEIAEKLNVKMPSVTGALRQLEKLGYIIYNSHYPVELTPEGTRVAEEVVRRHSVLKKFFMEILCVSPDKATAAACHLEHVVDSEIIERFVLFSNAIESRSDARELQVFLSEAMSLIGLEEKSLVLAELVPGQKVKITKIGRNLQNTSLPFSEGEVIELQSVTLDKSLFKVKNETAAAELTLHTAENLWVTPLD